MRRCLPLLLLGAAGCGVFVKTYTEMPGLPDGQTVSLDFRYDAEATLSVPGLDVTLHEPRHQLALWIAPLFVPAIPFPMGRWNRPVNVELTLHFTTYRAGFTFSPGRVRLRSRGHEAVAPSSWQLFGSSANGTKYELQGSDSCDLEFPVSSPLDGPVELQIDGIELDGAHVELPLLFLSPSYAVELAPLA